LAALRDAQRPRLRPLRGLEGTAIAFLGAGTDDDGDFLSGVVAKGMVIPSGLRHALAKLTVELQRRTRLLVVVELCDADAKGRFLARLMFEEGITWIDPASGRLLPSDQAPPEAVRLVTDCAHAISGLVVTNRADMTLRSPVALKCLAGPRRAFDRDQAEALDIDLSGDPFAQDVINAGIQVAFNATATANDANPDLPIGEEADAELECLRDALIREHPRQAERLEELRQQIRGPFEQNRERVERLVREGRAGWVNDLLGDFVGNGESAILVQADTGQPIIDENGKHLSIAKQPQPTVTVSADDLVAHLEKDEVERFVSYMYQDSVGNVTVGIGTNLTGNGGADKAVELLGGKAKVREDVSKATTDEQGETEGGATDQDSETEGGGASQENTAAELECKKGDTASDAKIKAEYEKVAEQEKDKKYTYYKQFTNLDIDRATARALVKDVLPNDLARIKDSGLYPDFETAPFAAQIVVMDISFNVKPKKFPGYKKTAKSFVRRDWAQMNEEQKEGRSGTRLDVIEGLLDKLKDQQTFFIKFDAKKGKGVKIDDVDAR
jgi:hypothetical protein